MNYRLFLTLIILGTIISWVTWVAVLFYFDPTQISFIGFSLFYLSFFMAFGGTVFVIGDLVKAKLLKKQMPYHRLKTSIRHAILLTLLVVGWTVLKGYGLLYWWNLILYMMALTVLEFFFISSQKQRPHSNL
ncbi:MAG: hypothetical protein HUU49_02465 [Candidatus Buchananbacteria bacterium]|nr:hypothetical protein [Candidatus Buchananbacteria bacterium]